MPLRIASFTSIPPRFPNLGLICEDLKNQTVRFDHILLNIPKSYRRFPEWDGVLPKMPSGIEINSGFDDLGPASKILPAVSMFADTDAQIFYCDDDRHLNAAHVQQLYDGLEQAPGAVIAASTPPIAQFGVDAACAHPLPHAQFKRAQRTPRYRARRALDIGLGRTLRQGYVKPYRAPYYTPGFADIAEGLAGVLCTPAHFDDHAFDIPESCWFTDDIWLSATFARGGHTVWNPGNIYWPQEHQSDQLAPLHDLVIAGQNQHDAHSKAVKHVRSAFGIWKSRGE